MERHVVQPEQGCISSWELVIQPSEVFSLSGHHSTAADHQGAWEGWTKQWKASLLPDKNNSSAASRAARRGGRSGGAHGVQDWTRVSSAGPVPQGEEGGDVHKAGRVAGVKVSPARLPQC